MLIKQDHASSAVPTATVCGNCGLEERRLLHHVRHRGIFRRLCTTCVLRLHPLSFCPNCFHIYTSSPPHDSAVTCLKCYSSSHSYCVTAGPTSPSSGNHYICPLCINPNSPIFNLKMAKEVNIKIGEREGMDGKVNNKVFRVIDKTTSKIFLAAAKIASTSMTKAAAAARAEAERRAKEAAFARKRAKEALEHVAHLLMKETLRKEATFLKSAEVSGPCVGGGGSDVTVGHLGGDGGSGGNMGHLVSGGGTVGHVGHMGGGVVQVKRVNDTNISHSNGSRSENPDGGERFVVVVQEKTNWTEILDRVDSSSQVVAALNAVELREKYKMNVVKAQDTRLEEVPNDNCESMDVDSKGVIEVISGSNVGELVVENNIVSRNINEMSGFGCHRDGQNMQAGKRGEVNEEMALVPSVEEQMHQNENKNAGGHNNNGTQNS